MPVIERHEFIKNQKNNQNLIYQEFIHNLDCNETGRSRWRCQSRKCLAILYLYDDNSIEIKKEHNHSKETKKIEKIKLLNDLKNKSIISREIPADIVADLTKKINEDVIVLMPKHKSLMKKINFERNKSTEKFQLIKSDIPESLSTNIREEVFLQFDSGYEDNLRYLIFFSDNMINILQNAKTWLIDGTFNCVPNGFLQLLSVHGVLFGKSFPVVYILSKSKCEIGYTQIFSKLHFFIKHVPKYIVIDLEKALLNSLKAVFNDTIINGCLFHFGQAIWRKLQNLDLSGSYIHNSIVKKLIRKILTLAFIPVNSVEKTFNEIKKEITILNNHNLNSFIYYFQTTYMGNIDESSKKGEKSLYNIEFWSSYKRIIEGIPRTTNSVESWHRNINQKIVVAHPNISKLIDVIMKEDEKARFNLIQFKNGKIAYSNIDSSKESKLLLVCTNYDNFIGDGFFNAIDAIYDWKFEE